MNLSHKRTTDCIMISILILVPSIAAIIYVPENASASETVEYFQNGNQYWDQLNAGGGSRYPNGITLSINPNTEAWAQYEFDAYVDVIHNIWVGVHLYEQGSGSGPILYCWNFQSRLWDAIIYNIPNGEGNYISIVTPDYFYYYDGWPRQISICAYADQPCYTDIKSVYVKVSYVNTPPGIPQNVDDDVSDWNSQDSRTFQWDEAEDEGSGIQDYTYCVINPYDEIIIDYTEVQDTQATLPSLDDGEYTFCVCARDNAGNYGDWGYHSFFIDSEGPVISVKSPAEGDLFNDDAVTVQWTGTETKSNIDRYEVKIDGGSYWDQGLSTSITFEDLDEGEHTVHIKALDSAGNSAETSVSFSVDTVGPKLTIISPEPGEWFDTDTVTVTWNSEDEVTEIDFNKIRIDDGSYTYEDKSNSKTFKSLYDGLHSVDITSMDIAGNYVEESVEFNVDTESPSDLSVVIDNGAVGTDDLTVSLVLSATDETSGLDKMCFSNDGDTWSPWEDWTESKSWDLDEFGGTSIPGKKSVYFKAKDKLENCAKAVSAIIEYDPTMADTKPPEITDLKPTGVISTSREPIISAQFSDKNTGDNGIDTSLVKLKLDGIDLTRNAVITKTSIVYEIKIPLEKGGHTVLLMVSDLSSNKNVATAEWTFTIDTTPADDDEPVVDPPVNSEDETPPEVTLEWPQDEVNSDNAHILVTFSDEYTGDNGIDLSSLTIKIDNNDVTDDAAITSSTISYTAKELSIGKHTISIEIGDNNGNIARREWEFTVTEDDENDDDKGISGDSLSYILVIIVVIALLASGIILVILKRKKGKDKTHENGHSPNTAIELHQDPEQKMPPKSSHKNLPFATARPLNPMHAGVKRMKGSRRYHGTKYPPPPPNH